METYLGEVLPYVPGCPEVVVEKAILEAAISLCNDTNCWRKDQKTTISPIPYFSTENTYSSGKVVELAVNGSFSDTTSTDSSVEPLAGWENGGTHDANNKFTIEDGACHLISDGTYTAIVICGVGASTIADTSIVPGRRYEISLEIKVVTAGKLEIQDAANDSLLVLGEVGEYTVQYTAVGDGIRFKRHDTSGANDIVFDNVSVKEISPNQADHVNYMDSFYKCILDIVTPPAISPTDAFGDYFWELQTDAIYLGSAFNLDRGAELVSVPKFKRDGLPSKDFTFSTSVISVPAWPAESAIEFTFSQRPTRDVTELPPDFKTMKWRDWIQAMAAKAKSSLYDMPGMPWHNPKASLSETTKYSKLCGRIRAEIIQPNPMTEMRVQGRPFV